MESGKGSAKTSHCQKCQMKMTLMLTAGDMNATFVSSETSTRLVSTSAGCSGL
jgi:hypothetical protein